MGLIHFIRYVAVVVLLTSCAAKENGESQSQWDFDHQVQFKQQQLDEHRYKLTVIANNKKSFEVLATFLMRKSLEICRSYGFKIEVLAGVEDYYDRRIHPNLIIPSLAANIECSQ